MLEARLYGVKMAGDEFTAEHRIQVRVGVFNLNTGQMLIKNSDWSRQFLDEVWAQEQFLHDRLWENRTVIHLWERQDLSDHVKVLVQKTFNSYLSNYTEGDFVLHFPDMPNDAVQADAVVGAVHGAVDSGSFGGRGKIGSPPIIS